jgi:hypothetical protein
MYICDGWIDGRTDGRTAGSSSEPEYLEKFCSNSVFKSLFVIGRCTVNMGSLVSTIGGLHISHQNKMTIFFFEKDQAIVIKFR